MLAITILDKPLSTTFYVLESHQAWTWSRRHLGQYLVLRMDMDA